MHEYTVKDILEIFDKPTVEGDVSKTLRSIASLETATEHDLSFLGNKKYAHLVPTTNAGAILLPRDYAGECPPTAAIIRVDNPSFELAKICAIIEKALWPDPKPSVHPSAVIDPEAEIADGVYIGPNVVVCRKARVAKGARLMANNYVGACAQIDENAIMMPNSVLMDYCKLGKRSRLQPGAVVGSDGYGYQLIDGEHKKIPQVGIVVIEDDVDIGANTCIDRARFDKTVVGRGTKVDNLVQIAHNVQIGSCALLVSQVGISGSTKIGNYAVLGGQVGVAGHLKIGDGAMIGGQSGINGNVGPKEFLRGTPAYPYLKAHKLEILKEKLPELFARVKDLEEKLGIEKKVFGKK